jgi:O-antigen/teichoic acid export membrane protein
MKILPDCMLHKRPIKEKLLKGGAWAFAGKLVTALSGLAISALLARLLIPEEMGVYFLTLSLVSVAAIVIQLGLTQTIIRLVAESMGTERSGRARQSVILVLRIVAFSGLIVACLLAFGVGEWVSEQVFKSVIMSQVVGLVSVWAVINAFQSLMAEVYRGFHDIRLATIFGGLTTSVLVMGLFLGLWLVQGHSQLHQAVALTIGAGLSSVLLSSVFLWRKLKLLPYEKNSISTLEILHISWPLWVTTLILFVLTQVDLWIMGIFRSPEEVAVYGMVARTVALLTMPLLIVNAVVPPLIAEMYAQGKIKELEKELRTVATLTGIPSLIVLVIFVFFGDSILGLFFGEFYQTGAMLLAILSLGQLANVWAGSCGLTLMLTGHQSTMMFITVFCGMFTAGAAWFLVESYGGVGVATAAACGMTLQNILMLLFVKKKIGIWTHADLLLIKKIEAKAQ